MAFRTSDARHLARFNSAISSQLLERYENYVEETLRANSARPSHRTFAPSSARCSRLQWFRLRGVDPDVPKRADLITEFTAQIGTSCHHMIQENMRAMLGDAWLDVREYLETPYDECRLKKWDAEYVLDTDKSGIETLIEVKSPYPIRFAVDGLVCIDSEICLLEIKSSEYTSWDDLTDPKPEHIAQVKYYCTFLGIRKVLFLYIDRMYGGLKCYEFQVTPADHQQVEDEMKMVMDHVDLNIPPQGLPKGDKHCSSSYCPYYIKCQQWGGR